MYNYRKNNINTIGLSSKDDLALLHSELSDKLKSYDVKLITRAFNWCVAAHKNQIRKSGLPYYTHPFEVSRIIVNEIPLDEISVAAALLHDACDNSDFTINDLQKEFGVEMARIVQGISQIQTISKYGITDTDDYRKMIMSWFGDIRIIIIALADRLHNMRTIEFISHDSQVKLAQETMDVFAPFANRFGLGSFKCELEDLSFQVLNPDKYNEIVENLQLSNEERANYIEEFKKPIQTLLATNSQFARNNVKFEISGRAKHIYSIAMKEKLRHKTMDELFDLFAIRIIIDNDDVAYCYKALQLATQLYSPIPGTLKNYIESPKENGYQSIHLAVIGMMNKPVEIQIRTKKMHDYAENGMAAHFKYKPGNVSSDSILEQDNYEEWIDSIRSIFESYHESDIIDKKLSTDAINKDGITVFTHSLESKKLPANATTIDFAYAIHTDIGNTFIGAKVNGKIMPINYCLRNGDQVEVINSTGSHPKKEWLDYVITDKARFAIKAYFKKSMNHYKKIGVDKWVRMQGEYRTQLSELEFENLVRSLKFQNQDDFFHSLGNDSIDISYIDTFILQKISSDNDHYIDDRNMRANVGGTANNFFTQLTPENAELSECCNPIPGDRIVGEMVDSPKLQIHRRSCRNVKDKLNPMQPNIMNINWHQMDFLEFFANIILITEMNEDTVQKVSQLISNYDRVNIVKIVVKIIDNQYNSSIKLKIESIAEFNSLQEELAQLEGMVKVERV